MTHIHWRDLTGSGPLREHPQPSRCARDEGRPVIHWPTDVNCGPFAYASRCVELDRALNAAHWWCGGSAAQAPVGTRVDTWGHHRTSARHAPARRSAALRICPASFIDRRVRSGRREFTTAPATGTCLVCRDAAPDRHFVTTSCACRAHPVPSHPAASSGDRLEREGMENARCGGGEAGIVTWMVRAHAHVGAAYWLLGGPRQRHPPREGRGGMEKRLGSAGSAQACKGSG